MPLSVPPPVSYDLRLQLTIPTAQRAAFKRVCKNLRVIMAHANSAMILSLAYSVHVHLGLSCNCCRTTSTTYQGKCNIVFCNITLTLWQRRPFRAGHCRTLIHPPFRRIGGR